VFVTGGPIRVFAPELVQFYLEGVRDGPPNKTLSLVLPILVGVLGHLVGISCQCIIASDCFPATSKLCSVLDAHSPSAIVVAAGKDRNLLSTNRKAVVVGRHEEVEWEEGVLLVRGGLGWQVEGFEDGKVISELIAISSGS